MDTIRLVPLQYYSHADPLDITREFCDIFLEFTYDGEGKVVWPEFLHDFLSMLHEKDGCSDEEDSLLLTYTLQ